MGTLSEHPAISGDLRAFPASFLPPPPSWFPPRDVNDIWQEKVKGILDAGVVEGAALDHPPLNPAFGSIVTRLLEGDSVNFSPEIRPSPSVRAKETGDPGSIFSGLERTQDLLWIGLGLAAALWIVR